ncbi:MAG TPA: hypothetical protein PKA88_19585 [Polyangiaceae bacterium]|nr:hypothetical protein [Polyangiaceae bacterium]HMR76693.1 hypothetical protein [Polyangiaceae bacterium]
MNDVAVPLARAGRALTLCPAAMWSLSESEPAAYVALIRCRWLANLFSPRWGELF